MFDAISLEMHASLLQEDDAEDFPIACGNISMSCAYDARDLGDRVALLVLLAPDHHLFDLRAENAFGMTPQDPYFSNIERRAFVSAGRYPTARDVLDFVLGVYERAILIS